jgi:hypothetical protein
MLLLVLGRNRNTWTLLDRKRQIYSAFFLTVAIGNCMVKLIPPVNFCSDENIQTIFGTKLEDFLNYRIDYNSISSTVEKVVKKIFVPRRNNSTSSGRQNSVLVGSTSNCLSPLLIFVSFI